MHILEAVEKHYLQRLKNIDAKAFFNSVLTERRGEIPDGFFSPLIWMNHQRLTGVDWKNPDTHEMFFHFNVAYTWLVSKPEYKIDPRLLGEIMDSDFPGKLPLTVLKTIPHWTGYVDISSHPITIDGYEDMIESFFISTCHHWTGKAGVTILFPYINMDKFPSTIFFPFDESLTLAEVLANDPTIQRAAVEYKVTPEQAAAILLKDGYGKAFSQMLNIALFVAQEYAHQDRADFRNTFRLTMMRRSGKKFSLRYLNAHRIYRVGEEYSEVIGSQRASTLTLRAAHIRCAHWHGYWTGPRSEPEKRLLRVKWIRASLVSGIEKD